MAKGRNKKSVDESEQNVDTEDTENEPVNNQKKYPCLNYGCGKRYSTLPSRSNHMKKCTLRKKSPKKRIQMKGRKDSIKYKCKFCPMVFKHSSSLYRHQQNRCNPARLIAGKEPVAEKILAQKVFICDLCHTKFDRAKKLERHMKKHTGENIQSCETCGRNFKRSDFYDQHILKCDGTKRPKSTTRENCLCRTCGKYFQNIDQYDLHVAKCDNTQETFLGDFPSFVCLPGGEEMALTEDENDGVENAGLEDLGVKPLEFEDIGAHVLDKEIENQSEPICIVIPNDFDPNESLWLVEGSTIEGEFFATGCNDESLLTCHTDFFSEDMGNSFTEIDSTSVENEDYDEKYRESLCEGVLKHLSRKKKDSDALFAQLYAIFGAKLGCDENLQNWLIKSLDIRKKRKKEKRFKDRLNKWLQPDLGSPRGRPSLPPASRQAIYDTWLAHSTISVDRRDGRDMVRMPMIMYKERYHGIESSLVTSHTNKRKILMAQAPRYMCHKTVRQMTKIIEDKYGKLSYGAVHKLRPFFAVTPSEREKLECLCTVCCNARNLFDAIQRRAKKNGLIQYTSITSYLTKGKQCTQDINGYISKPCITGDCENCCGIIEPEPYPFSDADVVTYYQFELKATGKLDKNGKPKKKTTRVDYNSVPVTSVMEKLNEMGRRYLLHRFDVKNDKFVWPRIQTNCTEMDQVIVHMDYSENLKEKPKFETQAHHFSGEQHSLHCSVVEKPTWSKYQLYSKIMCLIPA